MEKLSQMTEAEQEVMEAAWQIGRPATSMEILNMLQDKNWKPTTVQTFLARLTEKGYIGASRKGRAYYYSGTMTKQEYKARAGRNLLDDLYNGSMKGFITALYDDNRISEAELSEIKNWFAEKEDV